jgi:hypothetical protein
MASLTPQSLAQDGVFPKSNLERPHVAARSIHFSTAGGT